jgi:hypothetical protein
MIVSHQHKFIFAAVPKTGTHSVRQALRVHLGPEDAEQVGLFVNKRVPYAELAAMRHGHLGLAQVRPHLGEAAFGSYFKFGFVRNPFARFVSYCAFRTREGDLFQRNPQAVMELLAVTDPPVAHILFQPQYTVLADGEGPLLADMVGRVEDMQGSYDAICARIGIPSQALERVNGTSHGDYRKYYTPALIDAVAARYARDLELFGYEF